MFVCFSEQESPELGAEAASYKTAFHLSVSEYNSFGIAETNIKYQLDAGMAEQLYLFKACFFVEDITCVSTCNM